MSINLLTSDELKLVELYKAKHDEKIVYYFYLLQLERDLNVNVIKMIFFVKVIVI